MNEDTPRKDAFIEMVTAKASVDLRLSDYHPRSMLVVPEHEARRPKFPVIDYHNHLDAQDPRSVLRVMDECGVEMIVNITMRVGREALDMIFKYQMAAPGRFATYGWMDWSDFHSPGFFLRTVDRLEDLVEHGACGLKLWKDLGTSISDGHGKLLRVDDERLAPLFEKAAELGVPIMFHTSDPDAFFLPIDPENERYEELAAHPEWSFHGSHFSKQELLAQRDRVFARHPKTTFVAAHVAERPENLEYVSRLLETYSNVLVDIGARCAELGRQPYTARNFFLNYSDRILFGTDLVPESGMYRLHFRFLETDDQYFEYPSHASRQGRWNIYGLFLPDEVLRRVYRDNACRILKRPL
ncbi:MAG TPA: amidohydrolase family protein [Candidatus Polarisedimenticolia bacterium]|nr:amidohydrolase family protein [Candidatus Polarisedimenticolia bacterium]